MFRITAKSIAGDIIRIFCHSTAVWLKKGDTTCEGRMVTEK
jgi:hypothetical protein